jgi:hypothetical protein
MQVEPAREGSADLDAADRVAAPSSAGKTLMPLPGQDRDDAADAALGRHADAGETIRR